MDQFHKVKKKMSIAESTRQVLNKSIDLLHKLSNKKLSRDEINKQLSELLTAYFASLHPEMNEANSIKLDHFLKQAEEIVDKVANSKSPLYEAIMLMNKVVVSNQPDLEEENMAEEKPIENRLMREEEMGLVTSEFDLSGEAQEKVKVKAAISQRTVSSFHEVGSMISEVLKKQEELNHSILQLNDSLKGVGFELRPLAKERS
ncbi:MAG: hypothetical protein FJZ56_06380 [Chlamydiae bacterium]|nr:hypothetical protein [Chlamydiota bacterium]